MSAPVARIGLITLTLIELAIALALIAWSSPGALLAASAALAILSLGPLWQLYTHSPRPCGCGLTTGSGAQSQLVALIRNSIAITAGGAGFYSSFRRDY